MKGSPRNKQITDETPGVKDRSFMFPGQPPVTVVAKNRKEAEQKHQALKAKQHKNHD